MAYLILWLTLTSYVMCRSERECTNDTCSDGLGLRTSTGVGIDVKPIWKARVDTFDSCAEACVKKTRCKAVTFHADTRVCELHEVLLSPSNNRPGQYLVYSEFSWWPSTIDPVCYTRPCQRFQICVPWGPSGSASCLEDGRPVCPLPKQLNSTRTVGSVNVIKCKHGYIGGGAAKCGDDLQWNITIPPCVQVCDWPSPLSDSSFDGSKTTIACGTVSDGDCFDNMTVTGNRIVGSELNVTCNEGFVGGGVATCQENRTWSDTFDACVPECHVPAYDDIISGCNFRIQVHVVNKTWDEANRICECNDARLININNKKNKNKNKNQWKMKCVNGFLHSSEEFKVLKNIWTDGRAYSGHYAEFSDGTEMPDTGNTTFWFRKPNDVDNDSNSCISLIRLNFRASWWKWRFSEMTCDKEYPFICEILNNN